MTWVRRGVIWLLVLSVLLVLLRYDVTVMGWRFWWGTEQPRGLLRQVFFGLRDFIQIVPLVATAIVIAAYDRRRKRVLLALILAQVLGMILTNAGKHVIVRQRPRVEDFSPAAAVAPPPGQSWQGFATANTDEKTRSFPSGHATQAFAVAVVLGCYYPRIRWMFWSLAVGCAVSRCVHVMHWPSDCFAGAVLGYLIASATLRLNERLFPGQGLPQGEG